VAEGLNTSLSCEKCPDHNQLERNSNNRYNTYIHTHDDSP